MNRRAGFDDAGAIGNPIRAGARASGYGRRKTPYWTATTGTTGTTGMIRRIFIRHHLAGRTVFRGYRNREADILPRNREKASGIHDGRRYVEPRGA